MRHLRSSACAFAALALCAAPALAAKPSDSELTKVQKTLANWGCKGGTVSKESESGGVYEIDDAVCNGGNKFDVKLDDKFSVVSFSRY